MSSLTIWVDETEMPHLIQSDRLIAILYELGITTKDQLAVLTGWTDGQISAAIHRIRHKVPTPARLKLDQQQLKLVEKGEIAMDATAYAELKATVTDKTAKIQKERDRWLVMYQPEPHKEAYYTLGSTGVAYACAMRDEPVSKWKVSPKNQMAHYVGVNEILCRLRRAGIQEDEFLCGRETAQELYYYFERYLKKEKIKGKTTLYCRPDAYLRMDDGGEYFLEFDTGHEKPARLKKRFVNYLKLYDALAKIASPMRLPAIWVVKDERRKNKIEQIAQEVLEDWKSDHPSFRADDLPHGLCFIAGDDTRFLLGELDATRFW